MFEANHIADINLDKMMQVNGQCGGKVSGVIDMSTSTSTSSSTLNFLKSVNLVSEHLSL